MLHRGSARWSWSAPQAFSRTRTVSRSVDCQHPVPRRGMDSWRQTTRPYLRTAADLGAHVAAVSCRRGVLPLPREDADAWLDRRGFARESCRGIVLLLRLDDRLPIRRNVSPLLVRVYTSECLCNTLADSETSPTAPICMHFPSSSYGCAGSAMLSHRHCCSPAPRRSRSR